MGFFLKALPLDAGGLRFSVADGEVSCVTLPLRCPFPLFFSFAFFWGERVYFVLHTPVVFLVLHPPRFYFFLFFFGFKEYYTVILLVTDPIYPHHHLSTSVLYIAFPFLSLYYIVYYTHTGTFYENSILVNPERAVAAGLDRRVWQMAFHAPIVGFRSQGKSASSDPSLCAGLASHLDEAHGFLQNLTLAVAPLAQLHHSGGGDGGGGGRGSIYPWSPPLDFLLMAKTSFSTAPAETREYVPVASVKAKVAATATRTTAKNSSTAAARSCVVRCLVALGDISRYRVQLLPKQAAAAEHEYMVAAAVAEAARLYRNAHALQPDDGASANQLGTLESRAPGRQLAAGFHYCRAILAHVSPAKSAIDNLKMLAHQNTKEAKKKIAAKSYPRAEAEAVAAPALPSATTEVDVKLFAASNLANDVSFVSDILSLALSRDSTGCYAEDESHFQATCDRVIAAILQSGDNGNYGTGFDDASVEASEALLHVVGLAIYTASGDGVPSPSLTERGGKDGHKEIMMRRQAIVVGFIMSLLSALCRVALPAIQCDGDQSSFDASAIRDNDANRSSVLAALKILGDFVVGPRFSAHLGRYLSEPTVRRSWPAQAQLYTNLLLRHAAQALPGPDVPFFSFDALPEDHELRGYAPLAHAQAHISYDRRVNSSDGAGAGADSSSSGKKESRSSFSANRARAILLNAQRLVSLSNGCLVFYDGQFHATEAADTASERTLGYQNGVLAGLVSSIEI